MQVDSPASEHISFIPSCFQTGPGQESIKFTQRPSFSTMMTACCERYMQLESAQGKRGCRSEHRGADSQKSSHGRSRRKVQDDSQQDGSRSSRRENSDRVRGGEQDRCNRKRGRVQDDSQQEGSRSSRRENSDRVRGGSQGKSHSDRGTATRQTLQDSKVCSHYMNTFDTYKSVH